jgi:beta-lactamase class A
MPFHVLRRLLVAAFASTVLALGGGSAAGAGPIPGPLADLQSRLDLLSARAPGHIGVIIKDLATGLTTGINESANMPAASVIKIPVMVEVFRQMATGAFDLNRQVTLEGSDRDWGWGDLVGGRTGSRYTVARLLRLMITESDNTATNMLIRLVGRAHINATMTELGLRQTRLADYIRSDGDIRSLRTSPLDMTKLLDAMAHDRLIDQWSSRAMIAILTGQHHNGLLPEPLPPGTPVAHKTGTLHDTLNDVGIVYLNTEPYIIAVLTTQLPTLNAGRQFIRGVSRLAYDALGKFASWREANPLAGFTSDGADSPPAATQPLPDVQMWEPAPTSDDTSAPSAVPTPEEPTLLPAPTPVPTAVPVSPGPAR